MTDRDENEASFRVRLASDGGTSLIEILIAVMLMGVAFVSILGGMSTSILGSSLHREHAVSETIVRSVAEAIKHAGYETDCGDAGSSYLAALATMDPPVPSGYQVRSVTVRPGAFDDGSGTWVSASCPAPDRSIQQVTVMVSTLDTERAAPPPFVFYKRDPVPQP